jgi:ABC-type multidrug transport system fused ATPase/permease subunit
MATRPLAYFVRTFRYLRPYRRLAALSGVLLVVSSGLGLLAPWPLKILIDHVLADHPLPVYVRAVLGDGASSRFFLLVAAAGGGLLLTLLSNLLTIADEYVNTTIHQRVVLDFRSDLFQHAQRLSLAFHDSRRTRQLIFAINNQGDAAASLMMAAPPLAQSALTLTGMFWVTCRIDPLLAVLSLTVMPILYYAVTYYVRHIDSHLRTVKAMEGESLSMVHEALSMIKVIVAFGREPYHFEWFRRHGEATVRERVNVTVRQTAFSLSVNTTTAAGTSLVLGFGAYRALQGQLTVGELLVVMSYIAMVYRPLEAISTTIGSLQDQYASLDIAYRLLDEQPDLTDRPHAREIARSRGRVVFDNVSFSYSGRRDTLKQISFEAAAGRVVALVGPTGAGKTTVVSLIPRFYDPAAGRILLDGRDIRDYRLRSLRAQISLVLQDPLLFAGTIADNIRYGRLEATQAEIEEAARNANAHEFLMALPRKYETVVGERGVQLSSGERQRICVARAFLRDAPILILDEPTSSIDSKTEAVILDALDRLMVGRTTFLVAHRLSTIRHADLILVLNRGELVEQGTHDELMARGGLYQQLAGFQSGAAKGRLTLVGGVRGGLHEEGEPA